MQIRYPHLNEEEFESFVDMVTNEVLVMLKKSFTDGFLAATRPQDGLQEAQASYDVEKAYQEYSK